MRNGIDTNAATPVGLGENSCYFVPRTVSMNSLTQLAQQGYPK